MAMMSWSSWIQEYTFDFWLSSYDSKSVLLSSEKFRSGAVKVISHYILMVAADKDNLDMGEVIITLNWLWGSNKK